MINEPWAIKEALFHDLETGKPIGTEYWILDVNGEEIACNEHEHIARRIVACVNACESLETESLEEGIIEKMGSEWHRLDLQNTRLLAELSKLYRLPLDIRRALQAQNARLLEALKEIESPMSYMRKRLKEGEKLNGIAAITMANSAEYLRSIARTAIAEAEQEFALPSLYKKVNEMAENFAKKTEKP